MKKCFWCFCFVFFCFSIPLPAEEADQNIAMALYLEVTRIRDCHLVVPFCYCKPSLLPPEWNNNQFIACVQVGFLKEKKFHSSQIYLSCLFLGAYLRTPTAFKKASDNFPHAQQKFPGKMILILLYLMFDSIIKVRK